MSLDSSKSAEGSPWVLVALGANLGDACAAIRSAVESLRPFAEGVVRCSPLYQTTPVDCPPGSPVFVNAVAAFRSRPGLTPEEFLDATQELERRAGRTPKRVLNEARPLDLDIIAWGGIRQSTSRLILPHPRADQRRFVLEPLADLFPDLILPGGALSVRQRLDGLPPDPALRRMEPGPEPGPENSWQTALPH